MDDTPLWHIDLVHDRWSVSREDRRDLDLTKVVTAALAALSISSQPRTARFLERFLNHPFDTASDCDAFITEDVYAGRLRIESFLTALGLDVRPTSMADGSFKVVPKRKLSISEVSTGLTALGKIYRHLKLLRLRGYSDPTRVDGFDTWTPAEKRDMARLINGNSQGKFDRIYRGSFFVAAVGSRPNIRMDHAAGLLSKVLEAGAKANWPVSITNMVTVMGEAGSRFCDTHALTAKDWGLGSRFRHIMKAPNKGSKGVRVKRIAVSTSTVAKLRHALDNDPARPSMRVLHKLLREGRLDELERIYLFPSQLGAPYSYSTYNNHYIRPAMERGGVVIQTENGPQRPTGHKLRSGHVQEEVDFILEEAATEEEITKKIAQLERDLHLFGAMGRYVGPAKEKRADRSRIQRAQAKAVERLGRKAAKGSFVIAAKPAQATIGVRQA